VTDALLLVLFVCCCIIFRRIDKNQDMKIDWVEWRDYFDLRSAESLEDILKLWRCPPVSIAVYFMNDGNLFFKFVTCVNCVQFCCVGEYIMQYLAYLHLYTVSGENRCCQ